MEKTEPLPGIVDLGHHGAVDFTQLDRFLQLTPNERLDRHEGWRLFVKEALARAALREGDRSPTDASAS